MDSCTAFLEIVRAGSISKAADTLGYSQSSVSHMLKVLEDELGCKLLTRDRSGVQLTTEGEQLLPSFYEISNAQDRLREKVQEMHGLIAGRLHVAAFASVANHWLPYIVHDFHELYPHIEFTLMSGSYLEIESWIRDGNADCAFIRLPTNIPMTSYLLREDSFYAILPEGHRFAGCDHLTMEMLAEEPFILPEERSDNEIGPFFTTRGYSPKIFYTVPDIYTLITMVQVGLGVSILSGLALEGATKIIKKPLDVNEVRKIGIAISDKPSTAAKTFVNYSRNWVRDKYKQYS